MARWDPGAEERLRRAALELYREHGFENVSVAQITERAGLTRRTFFRYFADKREVVFAGSERLPAAIAAAIHDHGVDAEHETPLVSALEALRNVAVRVAAEVDPAHARARRAIITASPELQERDRTKLADCAGGVAGALREEGVAGPTADLVARVAVAVFQTAFDRWGDADGRVDIGRCVDEVTAELVAQAVGGPLPGERGPRGRGRCGENAARSNLRSIPHHPLR